MVKINEVFPNPTVKQVIFQIKFPELFFMEKSIGDLQLAIMDKFPKSSLIRRHQVLFTDIGEGSVPKISPEEFSKETGRKIWQFSSGNGIDLQVMNNSLSIVSKYHKTYKKDGHDKFRDVIKFVIDKFLKIVKIPKILRVGLRYQDECPIPKKNNESFISHYNTSFNLERFNIEIANEMNFVSVIKRDKHELIYKETLKKVDDIFILFLDYDSFATNIKSDECLNITDELYDIISKEYEETIKDPVVEIMKQAT